MDDIDLFSLLNAFDANFLYIFPIESFGFGIRLKIYRNQIFDLIRNRILSGTLQISYIMIRNEQANPILCFRKNWFKLIYERINSIVSWYKWNTLFHWANKVRSNLNVSWLKLKISFIVQFETLNCMKTISHVSYTFNCFEMNDKRGNRISKSFWKIWTDQ